MPIALSNWPIVREKIIPTSVSDFIERLNVLLISVKWVSESVANGYKYLITSPQGLRCYCYIRNLGHTTGLFGDPQVTFNFERFDGSVTGMDQEIFVNVHEYIILAGKSQIAIAITGINANVGGSSLIGGIPFIPDEDLCNGVRPAYGTDNCFIGMGDHNGQGSPRQYLTLGGSPFGPTIQESYEGLWGDDYCAGGNSIGSLRVGLLAYAPFIFQGFNFPSPDIWASGDFWRMEPFLIWGRINSELPLIRAQLWDSMIFSKPFPMDKEVQMDDLLWYVYTDNYFYGVLAFITSPTGDEGVPTRGTAAGNYAAFLYD